MKTGCGSPSKSTYDERKKPDMGDRVVQIEEFEGTKHHTKFGYDTLEEIQIMDNQILDMDDNHQFYTLKTFQRYGYGSPVGQSTAKIHPEDMLVECVAGTLLFTASAPD